jgi:2-polyprenyl-3-methyl-5-hydroxy-6-metoxy-1,4-benzoquinol methylase
MCAEDLDAGAPGSRREGVPTGSADDGRGLPGGTAEQRLDRHEAVWEAIPAGLEPAGFELRLCALLEHLEPSMRVLDVGCGEGRFAAALAGAGASVVGIDVAEEPLRRARERHPELELHRVAEAEALPFADSSFDLVWAGEVIEHVADTSAWLSELRRVLRSGASLLLSTPENGRIELLAAAISRRAFARRFDPRGDHLRFYDRATLSRLIEAYGFHDVRVRRLGRLPGRRGLLLHAVRSRF